MFEAIVVIHQLIICAQQSYIDTRNFRFVAIPDISMTDHQLADHLALQVGEVTTMSDIFQEGAIFSSTSFQSAPCMFGS